MDLVHKMQDDGNAFIVGEPATGFLDGLLQGVARHPKQVVRIGAGDRVSSPYSDEPEGADRRDDNPKERCTN
jgi:hypothetical protein